MNTLWRILKKVYRPYNLLWQGAGIAATVAIVCSGADWWYFTHLRNSAIFPFFSLAGMLGFFIPAVLVIGLLIVGWLMNRRRLIIAGWATAAAGALALFISSFYKFWTGRAHPPHVTSGAIDLASQTDISRIFHFGFGKEGVFWGWPSSHTAVAFAMSIALAVFFKEKKWVGIVLILYACYIALGASMSFHWLSDVVMGIILGVTVGIATGNIFKEKVMVESQKV